MFLSVLSSSRYSIRNGLDMFQFIIQIHTKSQDKSRFNGWPLYCFSLFPLWRVHLEFFILVWYRMGRTEMAWLSHRILDNCLSLVWMLYFFSSSTIFYSTDSFRRKTNSQNTVLPSYMACGIQRTSMMPIQLHNCNLLEGVGGGFYEKMAILSL